MYVILCCTLFTRYVDSSIRVAVAHAANAIGSLSPPKMTIGMLVRQPVRCMKAARWFTTFPAPCKLARIAIVLPRNPGAQTIAVRRSTVWTRVSSNRRAVTSKRIVFTGGTGKAGRHAVPKLLEKGHSVLNVDLKPLDLPGVNTLIADITDNGQVYNALTTHFSFDGFERGAPPSAPDAVVHFAAIPRVLIEPDNKTFEANVVGTYNVIEAAMKLGVRKVIIASSETTYGVCFAEGNKDFHAFPLDESYDSDPMDSYGLSKLVNEKTARAFAMRYGTDIYALRIANVIEPYEYTNFPAFLDDPMSRKRGILAILFTSVSKRTG